MHLFVRQDQEGELTDLLQLLFECCPLLCFLKLDLWNHDEELGWMLGSLLSKCAATRLCSLSPQSVIIPAESMHRNCVP